MKTHNSKPALKYWSDNLASVGSGHVEDADDSIGLLGQDPDAGKEL